jgi:nucleoid-associated protein Lsr2
MLRLPMPQLICVVASRAHDIGYGTVISTIEGREGRDGPKVAVVLEDDLTGGPAKQTVRFAFQGTDYEIDLNAKNATAFGKQLAPYIEHARKAGRAQSRRPGRTAAGRQRSGDTRAWAKEHGLAVSERGRIPASVVEQHHAASGR